MTTYLCENKYICESLTRLDFRRLPGPVFDPPSFGGMSAGSFSQTGGW